MKLLERLRRLPTSRAVVVSSAILALSIAMVGCDSSGGGGDSSTATTAGAPTGGGQPTVGAGVGSPDAPVAIPATDLRGIISGKVIDSTSGAPIPNATVTAGAGVGSATTDSLGNFTLTNAFLTGAGTPVILTITNASLPGRNYPNLSNAVVSTNGAGGFGGLAIAAVVPTNVISNVEIELHDQKGFITGTLLDTNGKPIVGAVISAKPDEIPVVTPGVVDAANPGTGIFPFVLTSAALTSSGQISGQTVATSDSAGKFTLANLPVNWIYDITIIPGPGIPNLIFTNQYLPGASGISSVLAFPDVVGAPVDSAVLNAFVLSGGAGAGSLAAGCPAPGGCGGFIPGAPVIIGAPAADAIPPFLLATSDPVDGTVYSDGQNPQGKSFTLRFNESVAQANNNDLLRNFIQLRYLGFAAVPAPVPPGDLIPTTISVQDNGATIVVTPIVTGRLAAGLYEITGLLNLSDLAANKYTGVRPTGLLPPPFPTPDAASAPAGGVILPPGGFDGKVSFSILEPIGGSQVGSVTNITCSPGACNNGTAMFSVTFGPAANAVQYFGGFATGQVPGTPLIPTITGPGGIFASAGPLADPPEFIAFDLTPTIGGGNGVPITLQGFGFPLVAGTESNGQIANNFFDDGVSYIVEVEGQSMAGIRGPQVVSTAIRDNVAPGLDTMTAGPAMGVGNDFNARLPGALALPATVNRTTPFTPLEDLFSPVGGDSLPITEGAAGPIPGTVGYNFANVTMQTAEGFVGTDIFYSAADYTAAATLTSANISIAANEDLNSMAGLTNPTVTPVGTAGLAGLAAGGGAAIPATALGSAAASATVVNPTGTVTGIAIVNDGDGLADENVINLALGPPRNFRTGDVINFTGSGLADEAGNPTTTSVRVANGIPAAITTAVARAVGANHQLVLTFDRPVTFEAGALAAGMLTTPLGLRNGDATALAATANLLTGTAALSADERSLLIAVPFDAMTGMFALSDVALTTIVDGVGLQTDDPLAFIGPVAGLAYFAANMAGAGGIVPSFLGVNTFQVANGVANGRTAIRVTDLIPPRTVTAVNADATLLNAVAGADGNGKWEEGDAAADLYTVVLTFSEPVFVGTTAAELQASAQARLTFSVSASAPSTAMYAVDANPVVRIPAAANPLGVISPTMVAIQFNLTAGAINVMGGETHDLNLTLSDLSGNALDTNFNDIVLGSTGSPLGSSIQ
jgi:hypothetical protein